MGGATRRKTRASARDERLLAAPEFEAFALQVEPPPGAPPEATARAVVSDVLGAGWKVETLDEETGDFEVTRARGGLSVSRAWDRTWAFRQRPEVASAEPLFRMANDEQFPAAPRRARPRSPEAGEEDDPATQGRFEWNLDTMRVKQAWTLFGTRSPGAGVRIAHPDTGYTQHAEIWGDGRLLAGDGFDFEDDDDDAIDELTGGFLRFPGHGTGTASVIFSASGGAAAGAPFVSGVAPAAQLVPIRVTRSVILLSMRNLVRAVRHAIERQCHVVSISLGGPVRSPALQRALRDAEEAGIIVLCAAGNQVHFVVFPAAFDEVIAVAASTIHDGEWSGSCRGPAVDVTAPGASVYRAKTRKQDDGLVTFSVERGSGTSFAVAATAGAAALWLSFHGRDMLVARYGPHRVAGVFKALLASTCRRPAGWNTHDFGHGIVDVEALLKALLPAHAPAEGLLGLERRAVSADVTGIETIVHLLAPAPRTGVEQALAGLLLTDENRLAKQLPRVADELAFHVGTNRPLRQALQAAAESASARREVAKAQRESASAVERARRELSAGSPRLRRAIGH